LLAEQAAELEATNVQFLSLHESDAQSMGGGQLSLTTVLGVAFGVSVLAVGVVAAVRRRRRTRRSYNRGPEVAREQGEKLPLKSGICPWDASDVCPAWKPPCPA